ncbi:MAG: Hsp20/alpha crystallin family protein [Oscillospiraceae bacterium]|nr:Hsp20/alpha crystallin family protein [Oscillospiraceae bacterium]
MFELIPFDRRGNRVSAYDPFRMMDELERSFFGNGNNHSVMSGFRTDVIDTGDAFVLDAELPGFKKEDIKIDVENDCLTISAERKLDESEDRKNYIKRERFYGSFSRSFDVSAINVDGIQAEYIDGVLKLTLPKKVETVPVSRRLEIK